MNDFSDALNILSTRSFGGIDVAVDPTSTSVSDTFFGTGPLPCGVEESASWFLDGVNSNDDVLRMIFLVGGPGNGKSFVANQISSSLTPLDSQNREISHREYRYQTQDGFKVNVINDASIVNPESQSFSESPLARDVMGAIETSSHLMVNVNRGVLYRELSTSNSDNAGKSILEWVADSKNTANLETPDIALETSSSTGVLHFARAKVPQLGITLEIVAVHLDGYSLLEQKLVFLLPDETHDKPEVHKNYSIQKLGDRSIPFTQSTPAGTLFNNFFEHFPQAEDSLHPFAANVENLKNPQIQRGVLALLRAAEIASNRRFSYRDLWGLIATSVLGQKEVRSSARASAWSPIVVTESDPISAQIEAIQSNASMRFHQALVGATPKSIRQTSVRQITSSHAVEAIRKVDPAIDARVGGVTSLRERSDAEETSWAKVFLDALSATLDDESFLNSILMALPVDHSFRNTLTDFERNIDQHIRRIMSPNSGAKDNERRQLLAWYGEYLTRLFAFSQGYPAFYEEIAEWILAWRSSAATGQLTREISQGLKSLLLPSYQGHSGGSEVLLPVFSSKTEPLIERTVNKVVAIEVSGAAKFSSTVEADELFATLQVDGKDIVKLSVDFSLMREILNCTAVSPGASEESITSVPRIERIRSSMLVSGKTSARAYVVDGLRVDELMPNGSR